MQDHNNCTLNSYAEDRNQKRVLENQEVEIQVMNRCAPALKKSIAHY